MEAFQHRGMLEGYADFVEDSAEWKARNKGTRVRSLDTTDESVPNICRRSLAAGSETGYVMVAAHLYRRGLFERGLRPSPLPLSL